jgi:hypothetical protein
MLVVSGLLFSNQFDELKFAQISQKGQVEFCQLLV